MLKVRHPGPLRAARFLERTVSLHPPETLVIGDGDDLFAQVIAYTASMASRGACFGLLSGRVRQLQLMTGLPGSGDVVATFHGPHSIEVPADVIGGSGHVGVATDGQLMVHCHAVFRNRTGRQVGGHCIPGGCIAGAEGLRVEVRALADGCFVQQRDAETGFSIFFPAGTADDA